MEVPHVDVDNTHVEGDVGVEWAGVGVAERVINELVHLKYSIVVGTLCCVIVCFILVWMIPCNLTMRKVPRY